MTSPANRPAPGIRNLCINDSGSKQMQALRTVRLPEALEQWAIDPRPMREPSSATIDSHVLAGDIHYIGIRHAVLRNISRGMLASWNRYFCYHQLVDSRGEQRSAFNLWHPRDHVSCRVEQHSLSGELGLSAGALITCSEKYGASLPTTRTARVLRLDEQGFHLSFRIFHHIYGLQMEDVIDTATGIELSTRLVLETKSFIREASERDNKALIEALKQAWIQHKVEEIGNLERILPCLFSRESIGWFGQLDYFRGNQVAENG
jgi:hypothetical protein